MTVSNNVGLAPSMRVLVGALVLGALAPILDTTMLAIAVHALVVDLHTDVATIQWVSTAYLLALVVTIPLCGWLDARLGGRRLWLAALVVFAAGSVLCAVSWNPLSLILFRTLQGAGAGVLMTSMQTIAVRAVGEGSVAGVTAALGVPIALGPLLGPILGGALLQWADWRWMFIVNVPLCVVAAVAAIRVLPDDAAGPGAAAPPLDRLGLALLAPGIALAFYGLAELAGGGASAFVLVVAVGVALIVAFGLRAVRIGERALVDVRLLRLRSVATSTAASVVAGGAIMGTMFLLPLYWQTVRGDDALTAALLLIPQAVGAFVPRFFVGGFIERYGPRAVATAAFALIAVATVPFAFVTAGTDQVLLAVVLFVRGLGLGAVLVPIMSSAYRGLRREEFAHASMLTRGSQQLGGAVGVAAAAVILQAGLAGAPPAEALHPAFWAMAAVTAVGLVCVRLLPGRD